MFFTFKRSERDRGKGVLFDWDSNWVFWGCGDGEVGFGGDSEGACWLARWGEGFLGIPRVRARFLGIVVVDNGW